MRAALLALFVAGCSTVDTSYRIPNWPADMRVFEHTVSADEIGRRCSPYALGAVACATWNTATKECHIWLPVNAPGFVVRHERKHCEGYPRHALGLWQ